MDVEKLKSDMEVVKSELQACKRKLDSKCEALLILSKDLDQCRQERDQFKLMAEQVQSRYLSIKRQLAGVGPRLSSFDGVDYADMKQQSLAQVLCEMRDVNKSLQFEVDDLKQKLKDSNGDIKLLREQIARYRVGAPVEGMDMRHFPAYEREDLVQQLEAARNQCQQMERDLQQVVDEKEELVNERDVYRLKYDRLNKELNYILKGDEKRVLDVDALIMENRYLQERIRQAEDEHSHAMATITKYKNILEKKKNKGILKLGQNRSGGVVISQKQVHQLLEDNTCLTPTPQMMADLQSLACALLESLNDKNLALSHQRKTNKILGARVSELEKKLKTLEMTGLWNASATSDQDNGGHVVESLEKLRLECLELRSRVSAAESAADETRVGVVGGLSDDEVNDKQTVRRRCLIDVDSVPLNSSLDVSEDTSLSPDGSLCCADNASATSSPARATCKHPIVTSSSSSAAAVRNVSHSSGPDDDVASSDVGLLDFGVASSSSREPVAKSESQSNNDSALVHSDKSGHLGDDARLTA